MLPSDDASADPPSHSTHSGESFDRRRQQSSRLVIAPTARDVHDVLLFLRSDTEYVGMRPPPGFLDAILILRSQPADLPIPCRVCGETTRISVPIFELINNSPGVFEITRNSPGGSGSLIWNLDAGGWKRALVTAHEGIRNI